MRIVHLTASTFFGGPERQMLTLAEHLKPDIETHFASFSEGGRCCEFLHKTEEAGFQSTEIPHDTPHFWAALHDLQRLIRGANIIFVHGYKAALLGRIAAKRELIPVIGVSRGWTAENWKVRLYERIDRWNLSKLDHVVCVSHGQARKVQPFLKPNQPLTVIHNAARLDDFLPRKHQATGVITILAAGRLSVEKGFQLIPAILAHLGADFPVRVRLAGDGPLQQQIVADAQKFGVQHQLELLGFRRDIDHLMASADLLLLPSFTEGLPNVVLEAAAAGIPAIATAVGGTPEAILQGQTGLLTPAGDVPLLADAIRLLVTNHALRQRLGFAARDYMEAHFSFAAQANAYRDLIERVTCRQSELQPC